MVFQEIKHRHNVNAINDLLRFHGWFFFTYATVRLAVSQTPTTNRLRHIPLGILYLLVISVFLLLLSRRFQQNDQNCIIKKKQPNCRNIEIRKFIAIESSTNVDAKCSSINSIEQFSTVFRISSGSILTFRSTRKTSIKFLWCHFHLISISFFSLQRKEKEETFAF